VNPSEALIIVSTCVLLRAVAVISIHICPDNHGCQVLRLHAIWNAAYWVVHQLFPKSSGVSPKNCQVDRRRIGRLAALSSLGGRPARLRSSALRSIPPDTAHQATVLETHH